MDMNAFLRAMKRRWWILLFVPLLGALQVAAVTLLSPRQYHASAVVAAPALVGGGATNQYNGSAGTRDFVANFEAAITSPPVIQAVAAQTHVSPARLRTGLTVKPSGTSSILRTTYTTTHAKEAATVVEAAAAGTVRFMFQSQVVLAEKSVEQATSDVKAIQAEISQYSQRTGLVLPQQELQLATQQLGSLLTQQAQFDANGKSTSAAALDALIRNAVSQLAALKRAIPDYEALTDRKTQATSVLNAALQSREQARAQFDAANPANVITLGDTREESPVVTVTTRVASAVIGGLFLAIGIVVLLELWARRSRALHPLAVQSTVATPRN